MDKKIELEKKKDHALIQLAQGMTERQQVKLLKDLYTKKPNKEIVGEKRTKKLKVEYKNDIYKVERIEDARVFNGKKQYFIKWAGYSEDTNTWENEENIMSPLLIEKFNANKQVHQQVSTSSTSLQPSQLLVSSSIAQLNSSVPSKRQYHTSRCYPPVVNLKEFLEQLKLSRYYDIFQKEDMDFDTLKLSTDDDLTKIGIPLGARIKIRTELNGLKHSSFNEHNGIDLQNNKPSELVLPKKRNSTFVSTEEIEKTNSKRPRFSSGTDKI